MADIIFNYPQMQAAVQQINQYAQQYQAAANTLKQAIESSTEAWTGASKDKFKMFMDGAVYEYTSKSIPAVAEALAELLKQNAEQMQTADSELAASLPSEL